MTLEELVKEALGCPRCKGPLLLSVDPGALHCAKCQCRWPIEDGVARLAPEDAVIEPAR